MELQSQLLSEDAKISKKEIRGELSHDSGRRLMNVLCNSKDVYEGIIKNATVLDIGNPQHPTRRKGDSSHSRPKKGPKQAIKDADETANSSNNHPTFDDSKAQPSGASDDEFSFDSVLRARSADQDWLHASVLESLDKITAKVENCSVGVQERFERWIDRVNNQKHGDLEATEILQHLLYSKEDDIARILATFTTETQAEGSEHRKSQVLRSRQIPDKR